MTRSPASIEAVSGIAWSASARVVLTVVNLATLMVLARILVPADFGTYAVAITFYTLATSSVAEGGFAPTLIQRKDITRLHVRNAVTVTIMLNLAFAAAVGLGDGAIAEAFEMPRLAEILPVLAIGIMVHGLQSISMALLRRDRRFAALATGEAVATILFSSGLTIALALAGFGLWALVWGEVAKVTAMTLGFAVLARVAVVPALTRELGDLWRKSVGFSAAGLLNQLGNNVDTLIVGRVLGADAAGVYSRVYRLLMVPMNILGTSLGWVLFPMMSSLRDDREKLRRSYLRSIALAALMLAPMTAFVVPSAGHIVAVVLGDQWGAAVLPLQVIFLFLVLRIEYRVANMVAMAEGATAELVLRQGVFAVLIILGALGGSRWGVAGVTAGVGIAFLVSHAIAAQLSNRRVGADWRTFLACHLPGLRLAAVVAVPLVAFEWLIGTRLDDLAALVADMAIAAIAARIAASLRPALFLGYDGIWLLRELRRRLPRPLRPVLPRLEEPARAPLR